MLKKRTNAYFTLFVIAIVHALAEVLVTLLFSDMLGVTLAIDSVPGSFPQIGSPMMNYLFYVVFCLTVLHHTVDALISIAVIIPLEKAKFFKNTGLLKKN